MSSLSRRGFLHSALAGAAAVACGRTLRAASPSRRINMGMIGVGRQCRFANLPAFLNAPESQVVAVCDVDSWRLGEARKIVEQHYAARSRSGAYKGCAAYRDFRELLARSDIDAVMISTPDHWHVPMAVMAAKAGKDVALEKPITLSIAEGRILSDTITRYGRVFRTDSEYRGKPFMHRVVELVRNGRIGRIHTIRTGVPRGDVAGKLEPAMPVPPELDWEMWQGPASEAPYTLERCHPRHVWHERPGWMRVRDYCEGMITNWGAHLNDIAQWGNNTDRTGPVRVEARGKYPSDGLWGVLIDFECHYEYADGVKLIYVMDRPYVRFEGDEGWIEADDATGKLTASNPAILTSQIRPGEVRFPLKTEKQDFLDAVLTRGRTLADAEVGHRTTSLCQIGHIAIQVGGRLEWDPEKERFTNNESANRLLSRPLRQPWRI